MTQEKKYTRVWKYHYDTITICRETDVLMTRCYKCWQFKPSWTANFKKSKQYERWFAPLCKDCYNKEQLKWKENQANEQPIPRWHYEIDPERAEQIELFEWKIFKKEDVQKESVESKVDRILAFLWLNKWAFKKS